MQIHFILVNPVRPENVGFAARGLKTMGFQSLRIVGSPQHLEPGARKTGYGSHDVLDQVQTFNNLAMALEDLDLIVGTTAKPRIKRYDYYHPKELVKIINKKSGTFQHLGIVFGSEENGLSTDQLDQCDLISTVPLQTDYPSLNLAQSVLIYAWEFSKKSDQMPSVKPTNSSLQKALKRESMDLLGWLEFSDKPILQRRILDRMLTLEATDMELVISLLKKIKRRLPQS